MTYTYNNGRLKKSSYLPVILLALCMIFGVGCEQKEGNSGKSTLIQGEYLGMAQPDTLAEIFAAGIISTSHYERGVVFSPGGDELVFQKRGMGFSSVLVGMNQVNGEWSGSKILPFSGVPDHRDACPMYSPDGQSLYFSSKRPAQPNGEPLQNYDIWVSHRDATGWSNPSNLGNVINSSYQEEDFSIAADGTLYFSSNRPGIGGYDIYRSNKENGQYQAPELLKGAVNTANYEGYPLIDPDQNFLIFLSNRPGELGGGDLFISFKDSSDNWGEPVNMGKSVNSEYHEAAPSLSPDGAYLFFTSFRPNNTSTDTKITYEQLNSLLNNPGNGSGDIYWVSTAIIRQLDSINDLE